MSTLVNMYLLRALAAVALVPQLTKASTLNFDFPYNVYTPVPFTISAKETFVTETQVKARLYRPSPDLQDESNFQWLEGPPQANMVALANYWAHNYDWFQVEEEINSNFSHYAITVQGSPDYGHPIPLHFVHERSTNPNAIALLLLHGWPSTHLEWSKVIGPLVQGSDDGNVTFHIVAPDLPGYGFSPAPTFSGLGPSQMGAAFHNLMKALGYQRYAIASTDQGWMAAMWMCDTVPDNIIGHFSDFFLIQPNATDLERLALNQTTEEETAYINSLHTWFEQRGSYTTVQSQAPLALGQALSDTPVGFAGWIWHTMYAGSGAYNYSSKELITDAMALFIQGTWGQSRAFKEFFSVEAMDIPRNRVPTGVAQFGLNNIEGIRNFNFHPREWIKRLVDLVWVSRHETGGHFPAIATPDIWVHDVRQFFSELAALQPSTTK